MKDRIIEMARTTWGVIGEDILNLLDEEGEEKVLKRKDVIDVVSDADYMFYHGRDREAYKAWDSASRKEKFGVLREAFPHKNYGF